MYSKIDLFQAYQQVPLAKESQQYIVINKQKGLFRYARLPFGTSSAPGIFQRVMESLMPGLLDVIVYIDDILVAGATENEPLKRLDDVLTQLEQAGLRAQRSECQFMKPSVTFLGHRVNADGLHPLPEKVEAVMKALTPCNVQELKLFLRLLLYYSKFLPNLSSVLAPLYHLFRKDTAWRWSEEEEEVFQQSTELITLANVLAHFNPTWPLVLACAASALGIGTVLTHILYTCTIRWIRATCWIRFKVTVLCRA